MVDAKSSEEFLRLGEHVAAGYGSSLLESWVTFLSFPVHHQKRALTSEMPNDLGLAHTLPHVQGLPKNAAKLPDI